MRCSGTSWSPWTAPDSRSPRSAWQRRSRNASMLPLPSSMSSRKARPPRFTVKGTSVSAGEAQTYLDEVCGLAMLAGVRVATHVHTSEVH